MIVSADDEQAVELRVLERRIQAEVDDDEGFALGRAEVDEFGHWEIVYGNGQMAISQTYAGETPALL